METSRRTFLKTAAATGAVVAAPSTAKAFAAEVSGQAHGSETAAEFTRGIGIYPGEPSSWFGPSLVPAGSETRNLALLRPAYHSSAYDYNLTAQLVTDGIKHDKLPLWISCSVNGSILPKQDREVFLSHMQPDTWDVTGGHSVVDLSIEGGDAPSVDRVELFVVLPANTDRSKLTFKLSTSDDGYTWTEQGTTGAPEPHTNLADYPPDLVRGTMLLSPSIPMRQPGTPHHYRVELIEQGAPMFQQYGMVWRLGQIAFYRGKDRVEVGGPHSFTSAWKSAGMDEEWVYVDLGARCTFDRVALHWIAPAAEGKVQVSDDAGNWRDVHDLTGSGNTEDLRLAGAAQGRYVRVLMTRPATEHGYILSELEVFGTGGLKAVPHAPAPAKDGVLNLAGGRWRLQRSDMTTGTGEAQSQPGFDDKDWIIATVPGTTLTSYFNAGIIQDPNFGENQLYISDSYFYQDFWYRTEFPAPQADANGQQWLCFDGINWKADVYLNGERLGEIDGAFIRGRYNVTGKLKQNNALAVLVRRNATPGTVRQKTFEVVSKNGGALGADNPTFHASIGWDWIPTIRGRNTGIWAEVKLESTGPVTLQDWNVQSKLPLPDTSRADVTVEVTVCNHQAGATRGTLHGRFGTIDFRKEVHLAPGAKQTVQFDPSTDKALHIEKPELWWPAGYGDPYLYDVELRFEANGKTSDVTTFKAGIKQMTYSEDGGKLRLWVNGRRLIARGGNWGFSEDMLRYRAREYDVACRYHADMHMNMIRNWVGQIGETAFYDACDRNGILVWQDFWLANPWDGPIPDNNKMFLDNARDLILKIRHHASMGIYCGRNEGFPPAPLEKGLRSLLSELHPQLHYIPSSADATVSGHGPYRALPVPSYFRTADVKLHSEIGAPTIPPIESVRLMMPEKDIWPQGLDWGLHDFGLNGAQGASSLISLIENTYGGANSGEEWIALAQFTNYDTYRAMFEAQSEHRMGVLLWMSHPCWPSFVWQTYDYYFEPTSTYFACKKACEPIHIQWNPLTNKVEVVNNNAGVQSGLTATAEIFNLDGSSAWKKTAELDSKEDSTTTPIQLEFPASLSAVHILRLTLSANGKPVSVNNYLRGKEQDNHHAIRTLPKAKVTANTRADHRDGRWLLTTELVNTSAYPALNVRLKVVRANSGDRILPALYSDNYFVLLPGEHTTITTEVRLEDTRDESPVMTVDGFNVMGSKGGGAA